MRESGAEATNQLYVSIGHTWGPMSTTQIVGGDSYATRVRLAWASSDELLVVYSVNKRVVVQTWKVGRGFGRSQTLGSCDFTSWGPDLTQPDWMGWASRTHRVYLTT